MMAGENTRPWRNTETFETLETLKAMSSLNKIYRIILFTTAFFMIAGCNTLDEFKYANSAMYNFADPKLLKLPGDMAEISGIAYYAKDTSVFAITDEAGILYKIPLKNSNHFRQWKFDKKRDFEDLVLIDSTFYALVSNGDIVSIKFDGDSIHTYRANFSDYSKAEDEFESLYATEDSNALIMVCKSCPDDPKKTIGRFKYNYKDSGAAYKETISINIAPVAEKHDLNKQLKPSAAAINPVTNELYILSSIQKLMLIFDGNGAFKESIKLNPAIYKQPEGIAFTPEGDMIISNESAEEGAPTLLLLKNKKKEK
ncbi:MAG: SdiA-regulated domain-containing protein [Ferruginibacter sp.]